LAGRTQGPSIFDRKLLSNLGIHVFGLAAIALGLVGLAWDDFADVWQPVPSHMPYRGLFAYVAAVLFLLSGVAVQTRRFALSGLAVLGLFYFVFGLLWIPRVVRHWHIFGTWGGVLEQFALVAAALVLFASLHRSWRVSTTMAEIARITYGICVIGFAFNHFFAISFTASMVPKWIPPGQRFWATATGVFLLLAGIAILSGVLAQLASSLLTTMIALFGLLVWAPSLLANPHSHKVWSGNAINLAMCGAAWIVSDWISNRQSCDVIEKEIADPTPSRATAG
jgi:uncharacterized membrane protein YphA (DoxX/SURF4 family)